MESLGRHSTGIVCVLLDPAFHGAGRIVRAAFGRHGVLYLQTMSRAMPTGCWVAMVGRVMREPARVVACVPDTMPTAIDAAFEMARHLGDNSMWVVHLPPGHQEAALALLAERTETAGRMQ